MSRYTAALHVRLEPATRELVERKAIELQVTPSTLVRIAVVRYLADLDAARLEVSRG